MKDQDTKYTILFAIISSTNFFFQGMIIEMIFNNKIQVFFFSIQFTFLKEKIHSSVHSWKKFKIKLYFLSFEKIINKVSNIENDVLCNVLNQVR
jgi:hypothetical protein